MRLNIKDIDDVREAVLGPGLADKDLRVSVEKYAANLAGVGDRVEIPEELETWVSKVSKHAYKTLDREVEELKAAGYTEDEIFEITIAAALGAARGRLESALTAVEGGRTDEA